MVNLGQGRRGRNWATDHTTSARFCSEPVGLRTDGFMELDVQSAIDYRSHNVRHRSERAGRAVAMSHMDVLLLT